MLTELELKRYNRHIILPEVGIEGQQKIKNAKVLIVGAGGLGSPVLMYLTAAGIGTIGIIDNDTVDISNLQRQILYSNDDIGIGKSALAVEKLKKQNPNTTFIHYNDRLNTGNAAGIVSNFDMVIDCTDNFDSRYIINDACVRCGKPFVFGSVLNYEGQVSVFNYNDGPTYRSLFPEKMANEDIPGHNEIGLFGVLPGIIGCMQANEAIKIITGIGEILSGKLLIFNCLSMNFMLLEIDR
jgi:molybdopterin/thiamine biosynthesis adenylyltransferase